MCSKIVLQLLNILLLNAITNSSFTDKSNATLLGQLKLSQYARAIVEHYKQENPIALPIQQIPEPFETDELQAKLPSVDSLLMKNIKIYGLSKFSIDFINVDFIKMKTELSISMEKLNILGNYSLSYFFTSSTGPFSINTKKVNVQASGSLEVNEYGFLEANDISIDFFFNDIDIKFENLAIFMKFVQNIINSMPNAVMDSIKPYMLAQYQAIIRTEINKEAAKLPVRFSNSVPPIDQVIAEIRRALRMRSCDPLKINNSNQTRGLMTAQLTDTWVTGITSIYRIGDVSFSLKNNTIEGHFQIGTQQLRGYSNWEVGLVYGGLTRKAGSFLFTIDHIMADIIVNQTLDIRTQPQLKQIKMEVGNIQVRFDGAGTMDYVVELVANVLPNLLRFQIMDALETPIRNRIQEQLDAIDLEERILDAAEKVDNGEVTKIIIETTATNTCPLTKFANEF